MSDVCIDASVIVKVTVPEELSDLARALVADVKTRGDTLIAPHLFEAEVLNVYRKKVRDRLLTEDEAQQAFAIFRRIPVRLMHLPTLVDRAFDIAKRYNWRYTYDAFYVALAKQQGCELWTADEVLVNDVSGEFQFVKWLGNYTTTPLL